MNVVFNAHSPALYLDRIFLIIVAQHTHFDLFLNIFNVNHQTLFAYDQTICFIH